MSVQRLSPEELAAIDLVTRRAREAHDRFVRELDGLMYDLQNGKQERRDEAPPRQATGERDERA